MRRSHLPPVPLVGLSLLMTGVAVGVVGETAPRNVYVGPLEARYAAVAADERAFLWNNALFALTMTLALGALYLLRLHLRSVDRPELVRWGIALLTIATAAFIVEVLLRFTVIVSQARDVAAGAPVPESFLEHPGLGELSPGLLVFRLAGTAGFAMFAWAASRSSIVGRRAGRVIAVVGAAGFLTIPLVPYLLAVAPLGATVILRNFRLPKEAPQAATG